MEAVRKAARLVVAGLLGLALVTPAAFARTHPHHVTMRHRAMRHVSTHHIAMRRISHHRIRHHRGHIRRVGFGMSRSRVAGYRGSLFSAGWVPGVQLTSQQRRQIAMIREQTGRNIRGIEQNTGLSAGDRQSQIRSALQNEHRQVVSILTSSQIHGFNTWWHGQYGSQGAMVNQGTSGMSNMNNQGTSGTPTMGNQGTSTTNQGTSGTSINGSNQGNSGNAVNGSNQGTSNNNNTSGTSSTGQGSSSSTTNGTDQGTVNNNTSGTGTTDNGTSSTGTSDQGTTDNGTSNSTDQGTSGTGTSDMGQSSSGTGSTGGY